MTVAAIKSYMYREGTAPNTRAAISQKNKIYGYQTGEQAFKQIGVVSEFGQDESRAVDPVRGVGFGDQVAELVPGVTEPMTLTMNKTLMYALNLFQTVGYKGGVDGIVRSLKHHRWPFDIKQELVFSEIASLEDVVGALDQNQVKPASNLPAGNGFATNAIKALFTYYEGCWFNSYSTSYTSDAAIVAENASVTVTDVLDGVSSYGEFQATGLAPGADGTHGAGASLRFAGGIQAPVV